MQGAGICGRLSADGPVDLFAEDVGVAGVASCLFDHVNIDPAQ